MVVRDTAEESRSQSEVFTGLECEDDTSSVSSIASMSTTVEKEPVGSSTSHDYQSDWVHRSHILHGIRLRGLAAGKGHTIPFSPYSAAIPSGPLSVENMRVTDVTITSTASPSEAALMRLGIAHTATAHVVRAASLLGEDFTTNRDVPAIHVTCRRVYARVLVQAELEDLIPNPQLVADIEKAISSHEQTEQIGALRSVLRRWGSNVATHIEIGCALVSTSVFETDSHIPAFGTILNPHDPRALLAAEKYVHNALLVRASNKAPGITDEDKACYEDLARQFSFKAMGGSDHMHMEKTPDHASLNDPALWTMIGVDGILPTLDLLKAGHADLYKRCSTLFSAVKGKAAPSLTAPPTHDLMISNQRLTTTAISPPCFALPGRLTFSKNGSRNFKHMCGYLEQPLPDFDLAANFSVCGWVKSSVTGFTTVAIAIVCAEFEVVLAIGQWSNHGFFQTLRRWPDGRGEPPLVWIEKGTSARVQIGTWQHLTFTQTSDQQSFFLDGRLIKAVATSKALHAPASQIKLCIGRGGYGNRPVDQWDGQIEGVKLWKRALTKDEVAAEAATVNTPR